MTALLIGLLLRLHTNMHKALGYVAYMSYLNIHFLDAREALTDVRDWVRASLTETSRQMPFWHCVLSMSS